MTEKLRQGQKGNTFRAGQTLVSLMEISTTVSADKHKLVYSCIKILNITRT